MNTKTKQQVVVPYFMVKNAAQFIGFAKAVFDAELVDRKTRENSDDVIHAEIEISGNRIFLADSGQCGEVWISPSSPASTYSTGDGLKPIQMFVYVESVDETFRKAIAAGGVAVMEPYDDDGGRMCGIADPFENLWWLTSAK
jgi:PhnB protein